MIADVQAVIEDHQVKQIVYGVAPFVGVVQLTGAGNAVAAGGDGHVLGVIAGLFPGDGHVVTGNGVSAVGDVQLHGAVGDLRLGEFFHGDGVVHVCLYVGAVPDQFRIRQGEEIDRASESKGVIGPCPVYGHGRLCGIAVTQVRQVDLAIAKFDVTVTLVQRIGALIRSVDVDVNGTGGDPLRREGGYGNDADAKDHNQQDGNRSDGSLLHFMVLPDLISVGVLSDASIAGRMSTK